MTSIITENLDVFTPKMQFLSIINVMRLIESYIRAPVLLNLLNSLQKKRKNA